jgi:hypothetical protein
LGRWGGTNAAGRHRFILPELEGIATSCRNKPGQLGAFDSILNGRGLAGQIKIAVFDDHASAWAGRWIEANGRGFNTDTPFDRGDSTNGVYIYDYNYKLFYPTVPDATGLPSMAAIIRSLPRMSPLRNATTLDWPD